MSEVSEHNTRGDIPFHGPLEHRWMTWINATTVIPLIWEISKQLIILEENSPHKYPLNVLVNGKWTAFI